MEVNTQAIIRLAWARTLGLADDALMQPPGERLLRVDESIVMFVALWQHRVLIGPQWLVDRAPSLSDAELASGSRLLALAAGHGGRLLDEAVLGFTDDYVREPGLIEAVVSVEAESVAEVERSCPPDDVGEAGLSHMSALFVTMDARGRSAAAAGYRESQGILGCVGVLVPPPGRLAGHGSRAAAIATNDALDAGLVAQWRARRGHRGALGIARRLGYREIGAQTTLLLNA